jgi:DNA-binding CsgD family transcriptional regulator
MAALGGLSEKDFRAALEFVRACELAPDLEAYRSVVLRVAELVPSQITSYNEVDLRRERVVALVDPPDVRVEENVAAFERHAHQHPVIEYMNSTGDLVPRAISDFLSVEDFHALDLYRDFYRLVEVEDQIAFGLPGARELVLGVAINRPERGFSERDREVLALVAPYAGRAYLVARARSRVRAALADADLRPPPTSAVVVLDRAGRAEALSPRAGLLLDTYLSGGVGRDGALPAELGAHVAAVRDSARGALPRPAPGELIVSRDGTRLRACLVEGAEQGEPDVLLLDTEADPLAPGRLRSLGLTEREAEVVVLVADGKANAEAAADLGISPRTVQRHLENVFEKLGVRTRAGVIGRLLQA